MDLAEQLCILADLLEDDDAAESFVVRRRSLSLREKWLGPDHHELANELWFAWNQLNQSLIYTGGLPPGVDRAEMEQFKQRSVKARARKEELKRIENAGGFLVQALQRLAFATCFSDNRGLLLEGGAAARLSAVELPIVPERTVNMFGTFTYHTLAFQAVHWLPPWPRDDVVARAAQQGWAWHGVALGQVAEEGEGDDMLGGVTSESDDFESSMGSTSESDDDSDGTERERDEDSDEDSDEGFETDEDGEEEDDDDL